MEISRAQSFWKVTHDAASLNSVEEAGEVRYHLFQRVRETGMLMNEGGTAKKTFSSFKG